ncbi:MAG: radical SAM protein [Anaerolineae bacterium]|nr:radical SAM protein [Anaerolineae bacterium]
MRSMDTFGKLAFLGRQMLLEPAEEVESARRSSGVPAPCGHTPAELGRIFGGDPRRESVSLSETKKNSLGIHEAIMPGGKRIKLLKTLLTSACERDCYYCPFRAGRDFRRATFKPEEMAQAFAELKQRGIAEGLFLSSGIVGGGVRTQDRLIDTAAILRRKLDYRGYLHLKLMPGSERDQVLEAMTLADRVSVNLEAPNPDRLSRLAPKKIFLAELLQPLKWAAEIRRTMPPPYRGRWPSLVTQFVVGAAGESDVEILQTTAYLTAALGLGRVYFSAFHPVHDTPLENVPPENPWREHRLYQASFLLRDYGFQFEDLPFTADGRLPLDVDPKLGWARLNLRESPVEVNRAGREELLKVPGIGPRGADAILAARRVRALREVKQLRQLGIAAERAAPFITLDGRRPATQLALGL